MSASRWRSRRAVERRLAWSGSCCSVVGHARWEGGRHGEATLPKKEKKEIEVTLAGAIFLYGKSRLTGYNTI